MLKLFQISSLENIMPRINQEFTSISEMAVLKGERASYQIAYCVDNECDLKFSIESNIKEHLKIYKIGNVPANRILFNHDAVYDDNYISHDGGMYPDILFPLDNDTLKGEYYYQGIWIETDTKLEPGKHNIKITISNEKDSVSTAMTIEVLKAELPEQKLKYCLAVHADCIASYYNIDVFSPKHWELLEKFIRISAEYGSNMLVPPIFTPPVDTAVGHERLTVQLVDMYKDGDKYSFDFSKFKRYIDICKNAGIKYFSMPQFFTQWGAKYTPKIIVNENGENKRLFGWDVESTDERYFEFLRQFVPALLECIEELGIKNNTVFSISDEPFDDETIERYAKLSGFLKSYLKDYIIIDAISNYRHYKNSGADIAIIPTTSYKDFEGRVSDLFVYYCCAQDCRVSNRLLAMPLYRNRSFGYQLYKYNVTGFLHWALNFYNSRLSLRPINPFYELDADGGFPAGDTFSVYPGEDGPIPSMRMIVFNEALQDLRAMQALEAYIGREEVIKLAENIIGEITFENCAKNAKTIIDFRWALRNRLAEYID